MKNKHLKIIISCLVLSFVFFPVFNVSAVTSKNNVAKKVATKTVKKITVSDLIGRLVIMNSYDQKFFYIEPISQERYFLRDQRDLDLVLKEFGLTIPTKEFKQLAKNKKQKTPSSLIKKYSGRIVASAQATSSYFYFNPADKIAYPIADFKSFYKTGKIIGLIHPPVDVLSKIKMNQKQFTYDPLFEGVAQVKYDGTDFYGKNNSDLVLPLASLTKIITALVFLETNPDWNRVVEITPEEITYPCTLQSCGTTSEVDLRAGDKIRIADLWIAMLTASSNQSAKILADNSGLSFEEFVARMNQQAEKLGLTKTKFVEVSGLSPNNVSTAEEFSKLAYVAFSQPLIASGGHHFDYLFLVEQKDGSPRGVRVLNRNYSLLAFEPEAVKTGYLIEAQRNAVVLKNGEISVVLHTYSLDQRNQLVKLLLGTNRLAEQK